MGGGCARGLALALKKPWKKVSSSAIRAALGFSLKHLKYLWGKIPEFFEVYFTWSIKKKHEAGAMTAFFFFNPCFSFLFPLNKTKCYAINIIICL